MSNYIASDHKGPVTVSFGPGDSVRIENPAFGDVDRRILQAIIDRAGMSPTAVIVHKPKVPVARIPVIMGTSGEFVAQDNLLATIANHIACALNTGLEVKVLCLDGSQVPLTISQEPVATAVSMEETAGETVPASATHPSLLRRGFFK